MKLTKSHVITISANSTQVRAAQFSRAGFAEKIAKKNIENGAMDVALRSVLAGFDAKNSAILWVLPGDVATTKNIEVPSVDPSEIESILALQAVRYTPFNKDEILISYIRTGSPKPNFTRVLLVVVKRDAVKDKIAALKSAGFNMETALFATEGIARLYAQQLGGKKNESPVALIDVNLQNTNFVVQANGTVLMCRNIPVGIEHLAVENEAPKHLLDEIKASLDAYEQEGIDRKPVKFYFTTNHAALGGVPALLAETLGGQVECLPYSKFIKANKAVLSSLEKDYADDSALDILSAGICAGKCQAEIIPQEVKDQRAVAEKGRETLKACVFFFFTLFFVGFALLGKVYFKEQFLRQNLIAKYSTEREDVKNLEKMITRTQILRQYLQARSVPLEAVRELYRIIPEEIYLSAVNMDDEGTVSLQGVSDSMSKVFSFVTALEDSPLFEGVKTKSTSTKKDRGKEVAAFEIVMKISSADAPGTVSVKNTVTHEK
ncbi:MAG: pilus assembly protein PilM [Candidatus Omnitrophica bacterium]|nr:pilus assembly protein PilM [Candidatus Omnitrophota bacterium]